MAVLIMRFHELRPRRDRAALAALLGRAPDLPRRRAGRARPKYYVLDMFPYPSGAGPARRPPRGLHRDRHRRALQAHARLQRAAPDGLGRLRPARRAVRDQDRHAPAHDDARRTSTPSAASSRSLGFSYDWAREVDTTDPELRPLDAVDLPPALRAGPRLPGRNPGQLVPGARHRARQRGGHRRQERGGGHPVERCRCASGCCASPPTPSACSTTSTALDWPEARKRCSATGSAAAKAREVDFAVDGAPTTTLAVFTTRPDTLFGATYMVLAPEHPLVSTITTPEHAAPRSRRYVDEARAQERPRAHRRSTRRRPASSPARFAINPVNGEQIPIWIADYVLGSYGTGASWPCPAHDERDFEFAQAFDLPIVEVVSPDGALHDALDGAPTSTTASR